MHLMKYLYTDLENLDLWEKKIILLKIEIVVNCLFDIRLRRNNFEHSHAKQIYRILPSHPTVG